MELLIPGLILVALMVYASTKIKKNAARAFEAEHIDNDLFSLRKPSGFVHVLNGKANLAFQAYTKDFGEDAAADFRRAAAEIKILPGADLESVRNEIRSGFTDVLSDEAARIGGHNYRDLRGKRLENGVELVAFYKIAAADDTVTVLQILALPEYIEEYRPKAEEFLDSFELK